MALTHGSKGVLKIGGTLVAHVQSWSLSEANETADTTALGANSRDHAAGLNAWSGSIEFQLDQENAQHAALAPGAVVDLEFYPSSDEAGQQFKSGSAILTEVGTSANLTEMISGSANFTGKGDLAKAPIA